MRFKFRMNRRAVLFSLISVLFSVLFITIFSQEFTSTYEDRIPGSNIRIKVMDVYTRNFEVYIGDSVKVATYHTLDGITIYQHNNGRMFFKDFSEFNKTFRDCMTCGYVNCSNQIPSKSCNVGDYSLKSRLDNITALSLQQLNIQTNYTLNSIDIRQDYPFEVEVTVNISYNVTDDSGANYYARWTKNSIITQEVPIVGLLEPTGYINDSTNTYRQRIARYSGVCEFDESCWTNTTTQQFYSQNNFRYYSGGVSFLQRYWNDNSVSDCCGIETIMHPTQLSNPDRTNSYIDHYYWSGSYSCAAGNKIVSLKFGSDNVSLDENTASRYGVTNQSTVYCTPP